MTIDTRTAYLIKALESFKRRMVVISPDFNILAAVGPDILPSAEAAAGQYCHQILYNRSSPCPICPVQEVKETHRPALIKVSNNSFSKEIEACLYAYPQLDGDRLESLVLMDFELPILEGLEGRLQRSNAFLRNLLQSAVDGIIAADVTGKILIFNDAASEISGYSTEEALQSLDIRAVYPADGAKKIMAKLRSEDNGGKGKLKSYQVTLLGKNGSLIPISLNAAIVYEGEREVATIGFFHDLRETLRMKKELEKTQIQLMQAEKMASLGKLAAGVAHQLNNPLGGITLFAKLVLEDYDLEEKAQEDLNRILRDAERCRDIVKELLEFARQTRHEMRPHDINRAVSRTLFLLENQSLFQNIEIVKKLESSLPEIPGDIQQLNHVFMNIILNAAQAMNGSGRLTIRTALSGDRDRVVIDITDTGPGIPDEVLPHIFEPFYTTKEEGKGTGLGLSMVYGIIENHHGKITATSHAGEGTTFRVELPVTQADQEGEQQGE
jgi:PAS domain S-box-containing protein